MDSNGPDIAIIGAGALGAYYGGRLAQHGHRVHLLPRSDYENIRRHGLTVKSCAGDFQLAPGRLNVYDRPEKMPKADWVIVALKTTANDQLESLVRPLVHASTRVLTLQNGLGNENRLAELFGPERILGGVAFTCINRTGPGVIEHTAHGHIHLGQFGGGTGPYADEIAAIFNRSQVECRVLERLLQGRWEKLIWNIPFNGLSAVLNQTTDQLLSTPHGEQLVQRIMREVITAAAGDGIQMEERLIQLNIDRTRQMGAYKSSMQVDLQMGRPLEVESILGEPVRVAHRAGLTVPLLDTLYHLATMADRSSSPSADPKPAT